MIYVDYKVKLLPMWIVWHLRCRCTNISCQKILHELLFSGHFTTPQLATRFARELFKPCKDSVESAMKIKFWFRVFVSDVIGGIGFWPLWLRWPGPRPQLLDGTISLKFLLETESFEPLIDFVAFLVQRLWPKNNKLII